MHTHRIYGKEPYKIVVVHGGPGAIGSVASIARQLSMHYGVLEPFQTKISVDLQVEELHDTIKKHAALPVVLIGHSWGAWLGCLVTARFPWVVNKLILVGSGPFDESYVKSIEDLRCSRLSNKERNEYSAIINILALEKSTVKKDASIHRLGELIVKTDSYCPLEIETDKQDVLPFDSAQYWSVWSEASQLRKTGVLLDKVQQIRCPVVAIHGEYDPHPADGVMLPLAGNLDDFHFHLLDKCGHYPWKEYYAQKRFYALLRKEIDTIL